MFAVIIALDFESAGFKSVTVYGHVVVGLWWTRLG